LETWLGIPAPTPKDEETALYESTTDALARNHSHDCPEARISPPSSVQKKEDKILFHDPVMAPSVDFKSDHGFKQMAKKKKAGKAAAAPSKEESEKKDEDESKKEEGGGDNGGDKANGDTGAGASGDGDGDKKDDSKQDPPKEEEVVELASFAPVTKGKKKKGKIAKLEEIIAVPDPPSAAGDTFDAFTEIELDDPGPMLDLSFDTGTKASGGFGSWGSSWNTGAATTK
jgi:hypothetical protein